MYSVEKERYDRGERAVIINNEKIILHKNVGITYIDQHPSCLDAWQRLLDYQNWVENIPDPNLCANGAVKFCFTCCKQCEEIFEARIMESPNEQTTLFLTSLINSKESNG
jgi:hypothetical protein